MNEEMRLRILICGNASAARGWLEAFAEHEGPESRHWHYVNLLKELIEHATTTMEGGNIIASSKEGESQTS